MTMTTDLPLQAVQVLLKVDDDDPVRMGLFVIDKAECGVHLLSDTLLRLAYALRDYECDCPDHLGGVA